MTDNKIIPLRFPQRGRSAFQIVADFARQFAPDAHKARFHQTLINLIDEHQHLDLDFLICELQGGILVAQANAEKSKE